MKDSIVTTPEYRQFISELKTRVLSARISASRAVNRDVIFLYWDIGRGIVKKQTQLGWGNSVVEMVARDLQKAFPDSRGFSPDNLWRMRQIYIAYSDPEFLGQAVPEKSQSFDNASDGTHPAILDLLATVPWGQNLLILKKIEAPAARLYYLHATAQFGWTRNVLLNQIKAGAYERSLKEGKKHNFTAVLPEHLAKQAEEALKSSYNLDFLGIRRVVKERALEDRLIERLKEFILALGYGFCFVGRQHRLTLGQKNPSDGLNDKTGSRTKSLRDDRRAGSSNQVL